MTIALANSLTADREAPLPAPDAMVMRFAGDSGDGVQLTGSQFTPSTALAGNDLATFADFPAEIRAPFKQADMESALAALRRPGMTVNGGNAACR